MGDTSNIIALSQAAAGGAGAYGQVQAGRYNAAGERFNARVADLQAADALSRGTVAMQRHRKDVKRLKSTQRATAAAQGIVVDQDIAQDIADDTDLQAAMDERQIGLDATREAWGHRVQAIDYRARARMERYDGNNKAIGTVMSTVGRFSDTTFRAEQLKPRDPDEPIPGVPIY